MILKIMETPTVDLPKSAHLPVYLDLGEASVREDPSEIHGSHHFGAPGLRHGTVQDGKYVDGLKKELPWNSR